MSKENLEQFMKPVADSKDLQAKIGEEVTDDALVALGTAHGCEFSIEDVQASVELSDTQMEGVSGGVNGQGDNRWRRGTLTVSGREIKRASIRHEKLATSVADTWNHHD